MSCAFRHSIKFLATRCLSIQSPVASRTLTLPCPAPRNPTISRPSSLLFFRNMSGDKSKDIDISKLIEYQNKSDVVIVDVREKKEIAETGILPGGVNIPLGELEEALKKSPEEFQNVYNFQKPSKETKIVFSCRSGKRSLSALETATSLGYTNSENFAGGWLEWEKHSKK